ncbi:hypothetical protein FKR81_35640 [Lentzea tibetensis]|uniref:Uncharacterized protein n=1 Tax=Lentzea tibetensis TaxID=2591470 RepID=A0A563EIW8_9PSEU|nr:hypothetical protein [Lentzea tibetensis]TWP46498.1 hypothetical protein FKR81_35640 [Lentzea tibetensis]
MNRVIGGALVVGPLVWLAGLVVRHLGVETAGFSPEQRAAYSQQPFAAPEQLAAYAHNPGLVTAGYALFAAGVVLMFPAVVAFARMVAVRSPWLAGLGGTAFVAGLFARWYFSGVDLTAFRLVDTLGLSRATDIVMGNYVELSYGLWRVPVSASAGSIVGGVLLAIGAYRAGVLGLVRCALLVSYAWVFMGVLKESDLLTVLHGGVAACLVFVPIGVSMLRRDYVGERAPAAR